MSRDEEFAIGARDWIRHVYLSAIIEAGGVPVPLPNEPTATLLLEMCHGLLLTGGGDFDPACYGEVNHGDSSGISVARDETELGLLQQAMDRGLPIFGICRGMQAIAVAKGGSLIQDVRHQMPDSVIMHSQDAPRGALTHRVIAVDDSLLKRLVSSSEFLVNSFHHQAIARVPEGMKIGAISEDQVVEAIESQDGRFILGVQWHPEDLADRESEAKSLFAAFVAAARQFQLG
ncbi:MAG: peptidase C26 [Sulfobacillus benefaciens]|uniref:Peptidase C26 n=1 Tax=Sulfobacillus benefaciens TaxID=453960 RepID=A0A2T2XGL5_9FIRM|nr:MAG: peptidase C26 [Sulfobacillus benefaciens]